MFWAGQAFHFKLVRLVHPEQAHHTYGSGVLGGAGFEEGCWAGQVTRFFLPKGAAKRAIFDNPAVLHFINPSPHALLAKYQVTLLVLD